MSAGDLTQRVTLQRAATVQDENTGEISEAWGTLATVWAAVEPQAGREFVAAGALQAELIVKVRIRYLAGITSADRVLHDGRTYNITAVVDYRTQKRELVLMCKG